MTDMRYRLKDRELQKKLDEISGGAFLFGKALNEACQDIKSFDPKYCPPIQVKFGQTPGLTHAYEVYFNPDQIERCKEYDPYAWNGYPEVEPPENVPMRIEVKRIGGKDHGSSFPFYGYFKDSEWIVLVGGSIHKVLKEFSDFDPTYDKIRFRPWDD